MAPATRRRAAAKTPVTATPSPNARGGKNPSAASPEGRQRGRQRGRERREGDGDGDDDAEADASRRCTSPRLPVFSSAFVFGLFALLAPIADRAYHALSTEGRMASDVPSFAHDLGKGFVVEWDKTLLELSVLHSRQDRKCASRRAASNVAEAQHRSECAPRVAWSTNPGLPFLVAANGPIRIHQLMAGHFKVDIRRVLQTTTQTLDSVEYVPPSRVDPVGTVIIRGVLIKDDARPDRMLSIVGDLRAAWNDMTHERLTFKAEAKLKASYTLTFTPASDARLAFEFEWDDEVPGVMRSPGGRRKSVGLNQVILRYASDKHERIYGMGEQYSSLEHKGKRIPIITAEQGIGRGKQPVTFAFNRVFMGSGGNWHTTYTAIPHYVTSAARSVFLTNYSYAEFDFTDDETISILSTTPTNTLCGQIIGARSIPETVAAYTEYSGRMEPLPEWAYANGVILGMTGGSAKVRKVASMLRDAGVPLAGTLAARLGRDTKHVHRDRARVVELGAGREQLPGLARVARGSGDERDEVADVHEPVPHGRERAERAFIPRGEGSRVHGPNRRRRRVPFRARARGVVRPLRPHEPGGGALDRRRVARHAKEHRRRGVDGGLWRVPSVRLRASQRRSPDRGA